ncbi:MAG: phage portal protein [Lachnospiraceae bacterium]|nr:phage portal protein [Lachnospiraceae bacterium]
MIYRGYKGYGSAGASSTKRSTKGFKAVSGSPKEDIDDNNYTLRQRGRLMYMGNPVATSAVKTHRTNTIGLGLKLNPRPDMEFLGLSQEEAAEWVSKVKREFSLWANHKASCDATGMNDFYEFQQLLLTSWLASGDVFVLIQQAKTTALRPYSLRLRAVEADLIATPTNYGNVAGSAGVNSANGNRIFDGVEIDASGMVAAYHLCNQYPLEATIRPYETKRIPAYGEKTGLPNVLHLMNSERPDQYRGVSYIAPVIIQLLQLNRYTESELTAALIDSYFTAYIQTNTPEGENPLNETGAEYDTEASQDPNEYEMGPGQVNFLQPGENVVLADPKRPASGFSAFVDAICTQIGAALEIPREILLKQFNASYSASRGALLEAWKSFKMYRTWFINDFCNPVYEIWLSEAVAAGRIDAPGFLTDPEIHEAWLSCEWIGPSQGQLDPVQEINAEIMACANGFSTHEDSALRLNGSDFTSNIEQLKRETELLKEINTEPAEPEKEEDPEEEPEQEESGEEVDEIEEKNEGPVQEMQDYVEALIKGFAG